MGDFQRYLLGTGDLDTDYVVERHPQLHVDGRANGNLVSGQTVDGATVQLTVNTGKGFFNGSTTISSGDTNITGNGLRVTLVTPEPTSISLLGTGLIGLATILRRKLKR